MDKRECDKEISKEEILQAINMLKGKKSPGIDELVNEFYKVFKDKLSVLKEVYQEFKKKRIRSNDEYGIHEINL